jgi:chemotaxis protein histidine kinase CheA
MMHVNLGLDQMAARLSHDRRVAVPFYRDDRTVALLQFTPSGPVARELPSHSFDENYKTLVDQPVERVALTLIGATRTCYLPGSRVMPILMEIFNMSQTNGTGDLNSLSQADLTDTYNKLAAAAKKPTVKSFKDKATAVKRIQALQAEVAEPSAAQKEAALAAAEAGQGQKASDARPAAKKAAAKAKDSASIAASKAANAAAKAPAKKAPAAKAPAKKAAAQKSGDGEKKPRGQGIGAFCMELIGKGKTNEEVLAAVKDKFPGASTSASSVAWYRNKLKQEDGGS